MNRLILFLIRKKLRIKKYQSFQFDNQVNKNDRYCFSEKYIYKLSEVNCVSYKLKFSDLSLNFLLSREAKERIVRL